jgi:hypothetical protein
MNHRFTIETEFEAETGRWIAEVREVGAMQYGDTERQAILNAVSLALRVLADKITHGEATEEELALVLVA